MLIIFGHITKKSFYFNNINLYQKVSIGANQPCGASNKWMFAYGAFLIFFKFQQIQFSKSSQFHFTKSSSNRHHKLLPTEYGKNGSHLIFFASTKVSGLRSQFKDLPKPT